MSLGEDRVRTKDNPSADGTVDQIKQKTAELIDLCEKLKPGSLGDMPPGFCGEQARLAAIAQTAYEEAAMWAVKAATTEKK